jgi:hypothetical protein
MEGTRMVLNIACGQPFASLNLLHGRTDEYSIHDYVIADRKVLSRELMLRRHIRNQGVSLALELYGFALIQVG